MKIASILIQFIPGPILLHKYYLIDTCVDASLTTKIMYKIHVKGFTLACAN